MEKVITLIVVVFVVFAMFLLLVSMCRLSCVLFLRDCYEVDPTNDDNAVGMQPITMFQNNICVEDPTDCEVNKRHSI